MREELLQHRSAKALSSEALLICKYRFVILKKKTGKKSLPSFLQCYSGREGECSCSVFTAKFLLGGDLE